MNSLHLYIQLSLILILANFISSFDCDDNSNQDHAFFPTKIKESPLVILGTSLNKNIDQNIRNLFNVTFLVECILKGRPTQRIISIVQAGSLLGRRSCQRLNANRQYIVFLEPFFDNTYRPVDFEEVPYTPQINVVLERTCGLSRTYPFTQPNDTSAIYTNRCPPAVSVNCPTETSKIINIPSTTTETIMMTTTTTTTMTTTTNIIDPVLKSTLGSFLFGRDPIDLAALSLLLAEHHQQNLSLALLQGQNHKSLFSDDDARKNHANQQFSAILILHFLIFSSLYNLF